MRLIITKHNLGLFASCYVMDKINKHDCLKKKQFVLGLPTGGTAEDMYKHLVLFYKQKMISLSSVVTFNMDEYIGIDREHSQSYYQYMKTKFFDYVDLLDQNINIPNGMAKNIKEECENYEKKILQVGGIDLFIGGVGENGHIAFNEQYSSLSSKTRDKELNKSTIHANARFFDNDINKVPKSAITVGVSTIMEAEEVMILVSGVKKAVALQQALEGSVSHLYTITALQMHKKAIIVADEEACLELKLKTYKYFLEIEDEFSYIDKMCENFLKK